LTSPASIIHQDPATRPRPALASDETFARLLFNTQRAGDFAAAGLPQATLEMLLDLQFRAQRSRSSLSGTVRRSAA
jgi:hypothetical protein